MSINQPRVTAVITTYKQTRSSIAKKKVIRSDTIDVTEH